MTRPATLSIVAERLREGVPTEIAVSEFLDAFYGCDTSSGRAAMLREPPGPTGSARSDALLGAIAEYLTKQFTRAEVPGWAGEPSRVLAEPWFTTSSDSDAMIEYLSFASPAEFRHHNIFTDFHPLRRARPPRPLLPE
jgi:hypothetical protein